MTGEWRTNLARKLQDRYGLSEDEASRKVEAWLNWLQARPESQVGGKSFTPAAKLRRSESASLTYGPTLKAGLAVPRKTARR